MSLAPPRIFARLSRAAMVIVALFTPPHRVDAQVAIETEPATVTRGQLARLRVVPTVADLVTRIEGSIAGEPLHLTPIEYRLLTALARHAGRVLTHEFLLREVWGPAHTQQHHYLRVYMANLRKKLERDPSRPELLITEQGVGYRFRDQPADGLAAPGSAGG